MAVTMSPVLIRPYKRVYKMTQFGDLSPNHNATCSVQLFDMKKKIPGQVDYL